MKLAEQYLDMQESADKPTFNYELARQNTATEKAMQDVRKAWDKLHAAQEKFRKTMEKHFKEKDGEGWDDVFSDLGA